MVPAPKMAEKVAVPAREKKSLCSGTYRTWAPGRRGIGTGCGPPILSTDRAGNQSISVAEKVCPRNLAERYT
jgi:hypothetical protein